MAGLPEGDPHDEGAEDGVDSGVFREGSRSERQGKDESQNAPRPGSVSLNPRQRLIDEPAPSRQHQDNEQQGQDDGVFDVRGLRSGVHHPQHDGEKNPAYQVVEHGRTYHHGSQVAPKELQIHQDLGDNGQRRDRKRSAHEQREVEPVGAGLGTEEARK